MPNEEVSTDQAEVETDQIDPVEETELPEETDGTVTFVDDPPETEESVPEIPDEEEKPDEPPSEPDPDPDEKTEEPKPDDSLSGEVQVLKKQLSDLNRALHIERTKKKEKEPADEEVQLSNADIEKIIADHGDNPETMRQLHEYMAKREAKVVTADFVEKERQNKLQSVNDSWVSNKWPALTQEGSEARQKVDELKVNLNLANHPMGDYLAASAFVNDNLPTLQKQWFEAGKAEALGEKTETVRKKRVANGSLISPKKSSSKSTPKLDSDAELAQRILGIDGPESKKMYADMVTAADREAR